MGLKILEDKEQEMAVLYCSVTMFTFGPVFHPSEMFLDEDGGPLSAGEIAQDFIDWLPKDARKYPLDELSDLWVKFIDERQVEVKGEGT